MRAVLAACLLSGVVTADAAAATGDLIQKPGAAGCLSIIGFCSPGRALDFAESVTVSPDGKNAYVASQFSNAVTVFDRAADGTLIQKPGSAGCISDSGAARCADGTALEHPVAVTVSPDGTSVYVMSAGSNAVAVFDRAPNGRLAQKPGADGCISDTGAGVCVDGSALDGPFSATVSPDGSSVYVAGAGSDAVVVFDRAPNGTLTQKLRTEGCISDTGGGECADGTALDAPFEVVVSPGGDSVYAAMASDAVAVFDRGTDGTLAQKPGPAGCISETGAGGCVDGTGLDAALSVTVSPNGRSVYVASSNANSVAMFDRRRNGRLVQKPGASGCISDTGAGPCIDGTDLLGASSVRVSPDGQSAYVANRVSDAVAAFDRAPNGTLAQKPATAGCISETGAGPCGDGAGLDGALSVAVAPDGESVYVASSESDAVAVFDREPIPPPSDTTRPLLSALALSPARFRTGGGSARVAAGVGADVSYRLSEPAAVRFGVERAVPGRRVRGRCVEPERSRRRATRCMRHRAVPGGFTLSAEAGRNSFTFRGRLSARKLPPGRYRLRAGATDPSGNTSRTRRVRFAIVRGRATAEDRRPDPGSDQSSRGPGVRSGEELTISRGRGAASTARPPINIIVAAAPLRSSRRPIECRARRRVARSLSARPARPNPASRSEDPDGPPSSRHATTSGTLRPLPPPRASLTTTPCAPSTTPCAARSPPPTNSSATPRSKMRHDLAEEHAAERAPRRSL